MTTNYELRPGQGGVFRNKKKVEDRQPGYTGKVMLPNGELRYMSVWVKKTKAGEPWLSVSVGDIMQPQGQAQGMVLDTTPAKPFAAPGAVPMAKAVPAGSFDDLEDSIPF